MSRKQKPPIERLVAAMDLCAGARGEAQWTNGYRTGAVGVGSLESERLYAKEQRQWAYVDVADKKFRRLAARLLREARKQKR
jgi:hypothetical protein